MQLRIFAATLALVALSPLSLPTSAETPLLVCTPIVGVAGTEVPAICSADLSPVCQSLMESLEMENDDGATCRSTFMGDCEVTEEGNTITEWAVSGELTVADNGDAFEILLTCGEISDDGTTYDGTVVAGCEATFAGGPCADTGDPIAGIAYCAAFVTSDLDEDYESWQYTAACEDPIKVSHLLPS